MGLTRLTAIEIFENPHDLVFEIGSDGQRISLTVARAKGGARPLINSGHVFEDRHKVVTCVERILTDDVHSRCIGVFGLEAKPETLSPQQIQQIVSKLIQEDTVNTGELNQ